MAVKDPLSNTMWVFSNACVHVTELLDSMWGKSSHTFLDKVPLAVKQLDNDMQVTVSSA